MKALKRFTNWGKKIFSSIHPFSILAGIIIVVLVLSIVILCSASDSGKKFSPDNVGRQVRIGWEEVNLRTGYSTSSEIITILHKGSSVTLTGNSCESMLIETSNDTWTEVQLKDGTIGWVTTYSINFD